jgi:hypothetical protein
MVEIQLDKPRNLRFNVNAFADLETATGWEFQELLAKLQKTPSMVLMRAILWASLKWEDKTLTLEQAGELINPSNFAKAYECCLEALNEFFKAGNPRPLSEDSPGTSSGPSAGTT